MRNEVSLELRRLRQQLDRAERRLAMSRLTGKVKGSMTDPGKRTVRVVLGKNEDGEDILSPPIRWQEATAGGMKIHSEPADGEQMDMVSASGTVGGLSLAMPASYDKDHAAPSKSSTDAIFERGKGRIELGENGIKLIGPVIVEGPRLEHNGKNVGSDHLHKGVTPGGGLTGVPTE